MRRTLRVRYFLFVLWNTGNVPKRFTIIPTGILYPFFQLKPDEGVFLGKMFGPPALASLTSYFHVPSPKGHRRGQGRQDGGQPADPRAPAAGHGCHGAVRSVQPRDAQVHRGDARTGWFNLIGRSVLAGSLDTAVCIFSAAFPRVFSRVHTIGRSVDFDLSMACSSSNQRRRCCNPQRRRGP